MDDLEKDSLLVLAWTTTDISCQAIVVINVVIVIVIVFETDCLLVLAWATTDISCRAIVVIVTMRHFINFPLLTVMPGKSRETVIKFEVLNLGFSANALVFSCLLVFFFSSFYCCCCCCCYCIFGGCELSVHKAKSAGQTFEGMMRL